MPSMSRMLLFTIILSIISCLFVSPSMAQTVMPTGIEITDQMSDLAVGQKYTITAQITLDGGPYPLNGTRVYFTTGNSSVATIDTDDFVLSNPDGKATVNLTAINPGDVTIKAYAISSKSSIFDSKNFRVSGFGSISGLITDKAYGGIEGATVTLYYLDNNNKGSLVQVADNPQTTSDDVVGTAGLYRFQNVPQGSYYVEATIDGKSGHSIVRDTADGQSVNIHIEDYSTAPEVTPAPTVEATPTAIVSPDATALATVPAATIVPVTTATPVPDPGLFNEDKTVYGIGVIAAVLAIMIVIVGLAAMMIFKK